MFTLVQCQKYRHFLNFSINPLLKTIQVQSQKEKKINERNLSQSVNCSAPM